MNVLHPALAFLLGLRLVPFGNKSWSCCGSVQKETDMTLPRLLSPTQRDDARIKQCLRKLPGCVIDPRPVELHTNYIASYVLPGLSFFHFRYPFHSFENRGKTLSFSTFFLSCVDSSDTWWVKSIRFNLKYESEDSSWENSKERRVVGLPTPLQVSGVNHGMSPKLPSKERTKSTRRRHGGTSKLEIRLQHTQATSHACSGIQQLFV
jgi:hypothetical protein